MGWKLSGSYNNLPDKCVMVLVPHTSWHDFYHGILFRNIVKKQISYLAKEELFNGFMGWFFRATGGIPVIRSSSQNYVEKIAEEFNKRPICRLALAPEGTRKKVDKLKTGFYHIAKAAGVPMVLVTMDYQNKKHHVSAPIFTTDNFDLDMTNVYQYFNDVVGKRKEFSFTGDYAKN